MKPEKQGKKSKEHAEKGQPKERHHESPKERHHESPKIDEKLIRILSADIPGNKKVSIGLTRIKGISFALANATCIKLNIPSNKKIQELNEEEMKKIIDFLKNPKLPSFLLNRRNDLDTGEDIHLIGSDLSLQKEFDIKRMKKIKSYKGVRHISGQPVRGQRTRSHFRRNRAVGVSKGKK